MQVEVSLAGVSIKDEDSKDGSNGAPLKVLPPWMIREGMNLTAEQRGEVKQEAISEDKMSVGGSGSMDGKPDSKSLEDDKEAIQRKLQVHCYMIFYFGFYYVDNFCLP